MAMREVRDVDVSFNERQGLLIRIYDYKIKHGTCSMAMRGRNTLALRTFLSFEAFSGVQGNGSTWSMDGALRRV